MKEKELRTHTECSICKEKTFAGAQLPVFYTVEIKTYGLILDALERQQGLGMMLGGHGGLAMVMGPDEDLAKEFPINTKLTVCGNCYCLPLSLAEMEEKQN